MMLEWQFCRVSPGFIYTLYHYPRAGLYVTGAVIGASVVVTAALIGSFNIDVNLTATTINRNLEASEEYLRLVLTKPYCRAASYLVGVGVGYVLYREQGHRTRRIPKVCVAVLWGCLLAAAAGLPLCPPPPPGGSTAPLYAALAPAAWAVAAATLGYLCCHGYAGMVGSVFSWRGWAPLSRLSYAVYMLHPLVTSVLCYSTKTAVYVSTATIMMYFTCTLVLSYIGAFVLCLLVEIPVAKVEAFFSK